ncbi:MAG: hypothetical protein PG981_000341 [Wolbachia endosymbiont of Ctenocephalides orientis wCori]|nr:MAG: hypothetical protein PG981_000341 [Wolbachia endosymbiont of Ctenocephalides orientis wCori]
MDCSQLSGDHIVSLYKDKSFEVKIEKNMKLAVLLHEKGHIKSITTDHLLNDEIHQDVADYLCGISGFDKETEYEIKDCLRREFINKESDEQRNPVPTRLRFLCLEQMITGRVLSPIKHTEPSLQ